MRYKGDPKYMFSLVMLGMCTVQWEKLFIQMAVLKMPRMIRILNIQLLKG